MFTIIYNYFFVGMTVVAIAYLIAALNNLKIFSSKTGLYILVNTLLLGSLFTIFGNKRPYIALLFFICYVLTAWMILRINIFKAILGVGLAYILAGIGELFMFEIVMSKLKISVSAGQTNKLLEIVSNIIDSLVIAGFILLIRVKSKIKSLLNEEMDRKTKIYLCVYIIGIFVFSVFNFVYLTTPNIYVQINIFLMFFLLMGSLMYILVRQNLLFQYKENQQLKVALDTIQELSQELRRFKHNYLNILHGFAGYIENEQWEELKEYFEEVISESQEINNTIFSIQKIKSYALLGLLSTKIKLAKEKNINFKLDVYGEIGKLKIKMSELCEVLGIYLDNAIEAAELAEEKEIVVVFLEEENVVTIIIENTCAEIPDMDKVLKGYSTKGKNRGFGLIIARQILSKYKDILFNTYLKENNRFRQEIVIPKIKEES